MQVKWKGCEKLAFFNQYLALFRQRYKIVTNRPQNTLYKWPAATANSTWLSTAILKIDMSEYKFSTR